MTKCPVCQTYHYRGDCDEQPRNKQMSKKADTLSDSGSSGGYPDIGSRVQISDGSEGDESCTN